MADRFRLRVYTPERELVDDDVREVTAPAAYGEIVVELKSVERLIDIHRSQILTYLKLSGCKVGLLINFNVPILKNGIRRYVLNSPE